MICREASIVAVAAVVDERRLVAAAMVAAVGGGDIPEMAISQYSPMLGVVDIAALIAAVGCDLR